MNIAEVKKQMDRAIKDIERAKLQVNNAIHDIEEIQTGLLTPDQIEERLRCTTCHLKAAIKIITE